MLNTFGRETNKISIFGPSRLSLEHSDRKKSFDSKDESPRISSFQSSHFISSNPKQEPLLHKPPLSNTGSPKKAPIKLDALSSSKNNHHSTFDEVLKGANYLEKGGNYLEKGAKISQFSRISNDENIALSHKLLKTGYSNSEASSPLRRTSGKIPNEHQSHALHPVILAQNLDGITNSPGSLKKNSIKSLGLAEARHLDSNFNAVQVNKGSLFSAEGSKRPHTRERSHDNIFRITNHDEEKKNSFLREKLVGAKNQEAEIGFKPLPQTQPISKKRSRLAAVIQSQNLHQTLSQLQEGGVNNGIDNNQQNPKQNSDATEELRKSSRLKDEGSEKQKSASVDRNCSFVLRNEKQIEKTFRKDSGQMNNSIDDKSLLESLKVMKFQDSPQSESKAHSEFKLQQNSQPRNLFGLNNNKVNQPLVIDENKESNKCSGEETNSPLGKAGINESTKKESETFGKLIQWKIGGFIGSGSFGQVYKAMEIDTGKIIAVKKIPYVNTLANEMARGIDAELMLLQKLKHPNIVQYLGNESLNNVLYIYMEHVAGGSIPCIYNQYGPLHEKTIKVYAKQILLGLDYLHKNGVIHKDIKGANILIHKDGTVKLSDFGCSSELERTLSCVGGPMQHGLKGSIPWMAPEVVKETGHGRRSDIWSFGCTILEMATGQTPWSQLNFDNPITLMMKIALSDDLPAVPDSLSEGLKDFILSCLRRKQEERPQAADLLLHKFLAE